MIYKYLEISSPAKIPIEGSIQINDGVSGATIQYLRITDSPIIDRGKNLQGANYDIEGDFLGVIRPSGNGWDIGAFEKEGSIISPSENLRVIQKPVS